MKGERNQIKFNSESRLSDKFIIRIGREYVKIIRVNHSPSSVVLRIVGSTKGFSFWDRVGERERNIILAGDRRGSAGMD